MKTIPYDEALKMLGLFSIAAHHRTEMYNAERVLYKMLERDETPGSCGHVSDALFATERTPTADDFWAALKREGFEVETAIPQPSN